MLFHQPIYDADISVEWFLYFHVSICVHMHTLTNVCKCTMLHNYSQKGKNNNNDKNQRTVHMQTDGLYVQFSSPKLKLMVGVKVLMLLFHDLLLLC